jgi:hypothetical protein
LSPVSISFLVHVRLNVIDVAVSSDRSICLDRAMIFVVYFSCSTDYVIDPSFRITRRNLNMFEIEFIHVHDLHECIIKYLNNISREK